MLRKVLSVYARPTAQTLEEVQTFTIKIIIEEEGLSSLVEQLGQKNSEPQKRIGCLTAEPLLLRLSPYKMYSQSEIRGKATSTACQGMI